MSRHMRTVVRTALCALAAVLAVAVLPAPAHAQGHTRQDGGPTVTLSKKEAGAGGSLTVRGKGWRPDTLLTLLVCGQNAIGGTNSCSNSEGRAVTTGKNGTFSRKIPVTEPPEPCPCVVRATTVTGAHASADAALKIAGHPVKPLPKDRGGGRLTVLAARLDGDSGVLNWFGAPEQRQLVLTVGNLGSEQAKDPVFEVGTAHGVFAPKWERQQWRGTVDPGKKQQVKLPVELSSGAHGDYTVAAKYGSRVLTEQPWDVSRPWGVTLFWVLLCVVVPAAVFRVGMAVVDRLRPRPAGEVVSARAAERKQRVREGRHSTPRQPLKERFRFPSAGAGGTAARTAGPAGPSGPAGQSGSAGPTGPAGPAGRAPSTAAPPRAEGPAPAGGAGGKGTGSAGLPWFTPDTKLPTASSSRTPTEE